MTTSHVAGEDAPALKTALLIAALLTVLYHALSVFWIFHGAMQHYTVHLGAILLLVAFQESVNRRTAAGGGRRSAWLAFLLLLALCTVASTTYMYLNAEELEISQPFLTAVQFYIGLSLLVAVLGLNWVVWGTALTLVCLAAALYFGFGHLVASPLADMHLKPEVVVSYLAGMGGPRGVYSFIPLSADTILLLLVYGGLMSGTHVLEMFEELGKALGNFLRGGVAYSCIAASTLVGMVTGQTVSCIALSGSMTIPTMVRGGFTREQAGAIEVMAANGSQIIPPVMGLGAFLMAVILGISYVEIAAAAILPAILFMLTIAFGVYALVEAAPPAQIVVARQAVNWRKIAWILPAFLPSIVLVVILLSLRYSAGMAALGGIGTLIALSLLRPRELRPSWRGILESLAGGAIAGAQLAVILAAIGIIVQMLATTGLGTVFADLMIRASGSSIEIALVLGLLIILVIGLGLPTPAAYSLAAIVVIPSLIDVGVEPLAAHFYGFYFAVFSSFTPPVAVGVLMASRISGGSFMGTIGETFKLGGLCMLLPFFIVAFPNVLQFPDYTAHTIVATLLLCISTLMLSSAIYGGFMGRLGAWERVYMLLGPASSLAYFSSEQSWLIPAPVFLLLAIVIRRRLKRFGAATEPQVTLAKVMRSD